METAQFATLISVLAAIGGTLAGTLKWAVTRITKALDDNTASNKELAVSQVGHAASLAILSTKIDGVERYVRDHTPIRDPRVDTPSSLRTLVSDEDDDYEDRPGSQRRRTARTAPKGFPVADSRRETTPNYRTPRADTRDDD